MKITKFISGFLGIALFTFGVLKFFNPFKGWYTTQISNSGLGDFSYTIGILAEISIGTAFILLFIFQSKISGKYLPLMVITASTIVIFIMLTGIYVHLNPNVPADVLPLKIKPPFIPGFFLALAVINIFLSAKQYRQYNIKPGLKNNQVS